MINEFLHRDYLALNYLNEEYERLISSYLADMFKEDIVFLCIGSDKCIGDAFGPLVGHILSENISLRGRVYGSLKHPINALNLDFEMARIKANHPKSRIVAVDASLGKKNEVGNLVLKKGPLLPGSGVGKNIAPIGDYALIGIVASSPMNNISSLINMRLYFVYEMARVLAQSIMLSSDSRFAYNGIVALYQ